jgi:hypothetical protein
MKKFLETLYNIYKIQELRERVLLTLGLMLVYRIGAQVVLPGIDPVQLAALSSRTGGGGLLGILNAFTGGAFANASSKGRRKWSKKNYTNHTLADHPYLYGTSPGLFVWARCFGCTR